MVSVTASFPRYYKSLLDNTIQEMVEEERRKEEVRRGKKEQGGEEERGKENQLLELTAGENTEPRRPTRKRANRNGYASRMLVVCFMVSD